MKFKSVFISDTHLGTKRTKVKDLLKFLSKIECDKLYLVGDIIDVWALQRRQWWHNDHTEVIRKVLKLQENGTEVFYVAGNHDNFIRAYFKHGNILGPIHLADSFIHEAIDGRRIFVTHGDKFDFWMRIPKKLINFFCHFTDLPTRAAEAGKTPQRYIRITNTEKALRRWIKIRGYDAVICGHTHMEKIDGPYMNCGNWVKGPNTFIAETKTGKFELNYFS